MFFGEICEVMLANFILVVLLIKEHTYTYIHYFTSLTYQFELFFLCLIVFNSKFVKLNYTANVALE